VVVSLLVGGLAGELAARRLRPGAESSAAGDEPSQPAATSTDQPATAGSPSAATGPGPPTGRPPGGEPAANARPRKRVRRYPEG
jgi:hypothetical protein